MDTDSYFVVSPQDGAKIQEWQNKHDLEKHGESFQHGQRYTGAIGGAYTFSFTPTGLGTVFKVTCSCGDHIDMTDYDSW